MNLSLTSVMIVDDDAGHSALMEAYLQRIGVRSITMATSGEEALHLLQNVIVHTIFLDGEMPGMSGKQLVGAIRDNPVCCHYKLAMVSGLLSNPTSSSPPTSGEVALRLFLGRNYVLPIPKEGLSSDALLHALRLMIKV